MKTKAREALRGLEDGCGTRRGGRAGRRQGPPPTPIWGTGGRSRPPAASLCRAHTCTRRRIVVGGQTKSSFSELISSSALRHELWGPWRISVAGKDNRPFLMQLQGPLRLLTVPSCCPRLLVPNPPPSPQSQRPREHPSHQRGQDTTPSKTYKSEVASAV